VPPRAAIEPRASAFAGILHRAFQRVLRHRHVFDSSNSDMNRAVASLAVVSFAFVLWWILSDRQVQSTPLPATTIAKAPVQNMQPGVAAEQPRPAQSAADEVVLATSKRDAAKEFVANFFQRFPPPPASLPKLDFEPENHAEEERERIVSFRQTLAERGGVALVARSEDGDLHFASIGDKIPEDVLPSWVQANLTKEELEEFQTKFLTLKLVFSNFGQSATKRR
jgi:hypothetical protein